MVLRAVRAEDAAAMFATLERSGAPGWEPPAEGARVHRGLSATEPSAGHWHQLGIARAETGELIGDCGVHVLAAEPRSASSASLAPAQGAATREALRLLGSCSGGSTGVRATAPPARP